MSKYILCAITIFFTSISIQSSESDGAFDEGIKNIQTFNKFIDETSNDQELSEEANKMVKDSDCNENESKDNDLIKYQTSKELFINCVGHFLPYMKNPYFISGSLGLLLCGPIGAIALPSTYWTYNNWDYVFQKEEEPNRVS
jgi:hypothetical protein